MSGSLGPWHVESKEFPYVLDQDSNMIVELPKTSKGRRQARLIATSPELLEAAQSIVEYIHRSTGTEQRTFKEYQPLIDAIANAIEPSPVEAINDILARVQQLAQDRAARDSRLAYERQQAEDSDSVSEEN
jgi:hypothetical protein